MIGSSTLILRFVTLELSFLGYDRLLHYMTLDPSVRQHLLLPTGFTEEVYLANYPLLKFCAQMQKASPVADKSQWKRLRSEWTGGDWRDTRGRTPPQQTRRGSEKWKKKDVCTKQKTGPHEDLTTITLL